MAIWISSILFTVGLSSVACWTVGPPLCSKDSTTGMLMSQFNVKVSGNEKLEDVFGCVVNATNNGVLDRVPCSVTGNVSITESGQLFHYLTIESKVNLNNASDTTNGCGITETSVSGQRAFQLIVGLRQSAGFIKSNDANYRWSCVEQSATDVVITTSLNVLTPDLTVGVNPVLPTLIMSVLKEDPPNTGLYVQTTTCILKDKLKLQVTMENNMAYQDYHLPWGLSLYNLRVGPTNMAVTSATTSYPIIGTNGCIVSNGLLITAPFTRQTTNAQTTKVVYQTGVGECKRLGNTNQLWFSSYTDFCFGQIGVNLKCINFCSFSNSGRKKRQDQNQLDVQNLYVKISIEDETTVNEAESESSFKPLLIGLTVGVLVLLVVVVAIAAYVFCSSRRSSKKGFTHSSSTSSTLSIHAKF